MKKDGPRKSRFYPIEAIAMAAFLAAVVTGTQWVLGVRGAATGYAPVSADDTLAEAAVVFVVLFLALYVIQIVSRKSVLFQTPLGPKAQNDK